MCTDFQETGPPLQAPGREDVAGQDGAKGGIIAAQVQPCYEATSNTARFGRGDCEHEIEATSKAIRLVRSSRFFVSKLRARSPGTDNPSTRKPLASLRWSGEASFPTEITQIFRWANGGRAGSPPLATCRSLTRKTGATLTPL